MGYSGRTLVVFFTAICACYAGEKVSGPDLFQRARSVARLQGETAELQAHLKLKLFDLASVPLEGRMDYAWRQSGQWHREISIPNFYREIDSSGEGVIYKDRTAEYEPIRIMQAYQLFSTVINPSAHKEMKWEKVQVHADSTCAVGKLHGFEEKWCFDTATGALASLEYPLRRLEFSAFQSMGDHHVPTLLRYFYRNKLTVEAAVIWDFQTHAADEIFKPTPGAVDWPTCSGMVPPKEDYTPDPQYPRRMPGVTGDDATVLLYVTIAADGKLRMPHVIESGGAAFDQAAIGAIRNWRFHPATCGGKAIPLQGEVQINFRYGRGGPWLPIYR